MKKAHIPLGLGNICHYALFASALFAGVSAQAAAPAAGTRIGNQASATYTDQNDNPRATTSNTVVTTVLQIPGIALTQDNTRTVSPGGSTFFPHTLTNTGNGTDSYDLFTDTLTGSAITPSSIVIYADSDRDGQPDDITSPITFTGDLVPGESFYFVIGSTTPGSAADGDSGSFNINGRSDFSETLEATDPLLDLGAVNTDTVNVSENAVITVTKSIDQAQGVPGTTPITYTLSYNNTGNTTATDFTMTDLIPAGMTYIASSGRSSLTGTTVLTDAVTPDAQAGGSTTVDYGYDDTSDPEITIVIASVPAGASGTVSFQVGVDAGLAPQIILNEVLYTYDPDGPTGGEGLVPEIKTNRPPFEVLPVPDVTLGDDLVAEARPGEIVEFTNLLTNDGNTSDTFDMTFVSNNYPTGTTFVFYQADGNTPMVDTNNNSIPDTGPVAGFGGTYNVVVKATLPTSIDLTTFPGPYTMTKRATGSVNDVNGDPATDDGTDTVTTILPPSVDITNATSLQDPDIGAGDGVGNTDGDDFAADPGATVIIPLTVENEGVIPDAYNLTVDPTTIPAGWIVNIRKVAGGAIVNNSGQLNPPTADDGESFSYIAEVIIPDGEAPGDNPLTFIAVSPTSGARDTIINTVTVNTVREISLISDNAGQISPGGSIVYEHILSNLGNVPEMFGPSSIALGLSDSKVAEGWTSVIYVDSNNNGVLDAGTDAVISSGSSLGVKLEAMTDADESDSARLFVKVFAPLGAPNAAINISTLTATTSGLVNTVAAPPAVSNNDTTTVVLGDLVLLKEQAVDGNNNGTLGDAEDTAFSVLPQQAKPGQSILYRVTVTNTGSADASTIVIYDTTPTATTYAKSNGNLAIAAVSGDGTVLTVDLEPTDGASGSFEFNIGTLAPGEQAVIGFGVNINE